MLSFWILLLIQEVVSFHNHVVPFVPTTARHQPRQPSYIYPSSRQGVSCLRLNVSTSPNNNNKATSTNDNKHVVFSKIVSTPPKVPSVLFLAKLVEYLQDYFQVPTNLPIPYETVPETQHTDNDIVISWDSPLSSLARATRLNVQVVGITTSEETTPSTSQNDFDMAMVVVHKQPSVEKKNDTPLMMQNMFSESEKSLLQALDVGLEDFTKGNIKMATRPTMAKEESNQNYKNVQQAIEAEIVEQHENDEHVSVSPEDVLIDTTAVSDIETTKDTSNKKETTQDESMRNENMEQDFAVQAAKKQAQALENSKKDAIADTTRSVMETVDNGEDFAVQAAKRIAQERQASTKKAKPSKKKKPTKKQPFSMKKSIPKKVLSSKTTAAGGFRTTISTPSDWSIKKKQPKSANKKTNARADSTVAKTKKSHTQVTNKKVELKTTEKIKKPAIQKTRVKNVDLKSNRKSKAPTISKPFTEQPKRVTNRNVNLRIVDNTKLQQDDNDSIMEEDLGTFEQLIDAESNGNQNDATSIKQKNSHDDETKPKTKKTISKQQMEQDVIKAAQEVMTELAESPDSDLYPEEMLKNVLEYGKQEEQQEKVGQGFVSGAFEKAKELLQERHQQRNTAFKEVNQELPFHKIRPDIQDPTVASASQVEKLADDTSNTKELTAQEELKRIFQAGERLAEGRITTVEQESNTGKTPGTTQEDIDELIAADKTISNHAKILDEGLVELEVQINKSPGEEMDGPKQNPVFDIFSGPEVYNPNVDPETAVNWPGAQPGTKTDVRLGKDLEQAVKQAQFAASVLLTMEEKQGENKETKYFVGDKELSDTQVANLRQCVEEAVAVGLIRDPLVLLAERSRLQMVLDEVTGQPEERIQDIISNYKDLLLSENFVALVHERLVTMADKDVEARERGGDDALEEAHKLERDLLGHLVNYAQTLLKETRALGAELEASQLEIVRSICEVAMDPSHTTEEETSMALADAVRDMRAMLDDTFVAYLKYAIAEEEGRLARAGVLDDPQHNEWLFVLRIVQQGVYAEISKGINRYIDHIGYVLRMETKQDRRALLKKFIDVMPTMDVRPFVQVVDNIAGALGDSTRGDFDDSSHVLGDMSNNLLQLHRDVHELLPPERIKLMSRDADEWAAKQRERLMKQRKTTLQRLKAAQETQDYNEEIRRRGEMERMT